MLTRHVIKVVEVSPWVTLTYWSDGIIEETRNCPPPTLAQQASKVLAEALNDDEC